MRIPDYKIWVSKHKVMTYLLEIDFTFNRVTVPDINDEDLYDFNNVVFLEYTGLKDKTDKKIYEGDVVKYFRIGYEKLQIGEIRWINCGFVIVTDTYSNIGLCSQQRDLLLLLEPGFTYEIIGNIYENPELVEVK